ncbi:MAG: flagellar biosynthesis protein FlhB [Gammaproteobacteria bacterium]|nr:MAG: flagellar biosynthesis protein FlhB [Gammaproteobacteria bacterium]
MAENEDGQEKTQEPTSKRLDDARKKGQVPRSRELNTMALTIMGVSAMMLMAGRFGEGFESQFRQHLILRREDLFDPSALLTHLVAAIQEAVLMLLPFFGVMIVVAVAASVALGGFNLSVEAMQPKLSKLDPLKGMKRVFGVKGLMELAKSLAKFLLVMLVTASVLWSWQDDILGLGGQDVGQALVAGLRMVGWAALLISSTMVLMAVIDVPFQLWQHKKELKMTQQEVRDELKQTEGRPEVKGRIRQLQREMAQRRMMQEVPKADVIVTNPTHYAVALRYDPDTMNAPVVIAKGKDLVAANIRRIGGEHEIPLIEAPVLARAIYFNTELNQPIPAQLFLAVAQLLAYVFQLRAWKEGEADRPSMPEEFPVPEEMRHD